MRQIIVAPGPMAHLAAAAVVLSLAACDDRREPKVVEEIESARP